MQQDDHIVILENHIQKLYSYSNDFEAWLDTASEQADKIFGGLNQQSRNIQNIRSDYRIHKIYNKKPSPPIFQSLPKSLDEFEKRSKQLLEGFIEQLIEDKKGSMQKHQYQILLNQQKQKEVEQQRISIEKQAKEAKLQLENERKQKELEEKNKPKIKKRWFQYNLEKKLFEFTRPELYSIIALSLAAISIAFTIGLNQGKAKFDSEKQTFYEENNQLKRDTANYLAKTRNDSILIDSIKTKSHTKY